MSGGIPFDAINAAALARIESLLREWFPRGKKESHWWRVGSINGEPGESFSINMQTGQWGEWNGYGPKGGDLISLFAALSCNGNQGEAARVLAGQFGIEIGRPKPSQAPDREQWFPMIPPPPEAARLPDDMRRGFDTVHEYTSLDDRVTHFVGRIEARNGERKKFVPITYGTLTKNGVTTTGWQKKAPNPPRPLYGLNKLTSMPDALVILCEGEKAADAAQRMFPDHACLSWYGGGGQVGDADLTPLATRAVIAWPDADDSGIHAMRTLIPKLPGDTMVVRVDGLPDGFDAADLEHQGCDDPEAWLRARIRNPPDGDGEPTPNGVFVRRTTLRDEKDIPQRPWIAPGFLLRRAVTLLFGPPDQGKTLLLVIWAVALALGRRWGMFHPKAPLRVLTVLTEEDDDEQEARFAAALRAFGVNTADVERNLRRLVVHEVATLLEVDGTNGAVTPTKGWEDLYHEIETFRPDVVVLDPLIELHTAEENANTQLKAVVGRIRTVARNRNLAVLLSHHIGKKGANLTPGNLEDARGASATGAAVRIAYTFMEALPADVERLGISERQRRYFCRLDRARTSQAPPTTDDAEWFEKHSFNLDNGDATPALLPWQPPEGHAPDQVALARLLDAIGKGCPEAAGDPWSPQLRDGKPRSVRKLFERHGISRVSEKPTLEALRGLGMVEASFPDRHRHPRLGLRTQEGLPQARWSDGEETSQ